MSNIQEDIDWVDKHYFQLQEQYPDMWIAVHNKKVIAYDKKSGVVRNKALEKIGKEDFFMEYILSGELVVF